MTPEQLADAILRAAGPNRETDVEIAVIIMGMVKEDNLLHHTDETYVIERDYYSLEGGPRELPHYTASVDAALRLIPAGWALSSLSQTPAVVKEEHTGWEPLPNWSAALIREDRAGYRNRRNFRKAFEHGAGATAPLAILSAALAARTQQASELPQ